MTRIEMAYCLKRAATALESPQPDKSALAAAKVIMLSHVLHDGELLGVNDAGIGAVHLSSTGPLHDNAATKKMMAEMLGKKAEVQS